MTKLYQSDSPPTDLMCHRPCQDTNIKPANWQECGIEFDCKMSPQANTDPDLMCNPTGEDAGKMCDVWVSWRKYNYEWIEFYVVAKKLDVDYQYLAVGFAPSDEGLTDLMVSE